MSPRPHLVTSQQVRALAENASPRADLALLVAAEASKTAAMLAHIVREAEVSGHPEAGLAVAAWRLLARLQRAAPGAVSEVLRYPSVGAWAARLIVSGLAVPGASAGWLAVVAAAAAVRGGIPATVELPPSAFRDGAVHLPSLGTVLLAPGPGGPGGILRHDGDAIEVAGPGGRLTLPGLGAAAPGWRPLPTVSARTDGQSLRLVIDDADPHRPTGDIAPASRLAPAARARWRYRIAGGWRILARHHQQAAAEVSALIRAVVPLTAEEGDMRSITSRQMFGGIGLSFPRDDVLMALTLAHEVQHAKLSALMDLVPLVTNSATDSYYVPWRPDHRPLASLLQGTYAHLGVARFWRRHREVVSGTMEVWQANVEFAKWRGACVLTADSVHGNANLTSCGSAFVDGMTSVLRSWHGDRIPAGAVAQAERELSEHQGQWEAPSGTNVTKDPPCRETDGITRAPSRAEG